MIKSYSNGSTSSDEEDTEEYSPPSKDTFSDILLNAFTNLAYNLKHSNYLKIPMLQRQRIKLINESDCASYLGKHYLSSTFEEFLIHYRNTIWFSYRKGIKDIKDDRGWGCMIRVVQMMLAEVIQRVEQRGAKSAIQYFREDPTCQLSLYNICKQGDINKRWTNASEVVDTCQKILESHTDIQLSIINGTSSCFASSKVAQNFKIHKNKQCLFIVHLRLGLDNIEEKYIPHLKSLMQVEQFVGMLGGTTGQAMYIVGCNNEKAIILDPHYVQDCSETCARSYFKKNPRGIDFKKLSSSISVGFLIKDKDDLEQLLFNLSYLDSEHEDKALQLLLNENQKQVLEKKRKQRRKISTDFQIIE